MSRCPPPSRRKVQTKTAVVGADEDESPELSKRLIEDTIARCRDQKISSALRSPHFENEQVSPELVATVVTWLCLEDPLTGNR